MHLIETGNPGGAEQMMLSLIHGLDPARHDNQVVLLKTGWLEQKTREQGVSVTIVPLNRRFDWRFVLTLCRLARRRGIDVLHSHEFAMNVYSSLVGLLTRRATVATVHGNLSYLQARFRRRQAYRLIARLAGPMVVVSEEMRGQVAARFGIDAARLRVIPNGVEAHEQLPGREEIRARREKLGLPAEAFLIGVIGSLYPVKGQMTLIEAMPQLVAADDRAHLAVVGRGDMRAALEKRTAGLGLGAHVTFTGYLENVRELLPIFDLIVVPSRYEGLSLLVLEAMAWARPVIATQVGGNPEAIVDGESGLLTPPDDPPVLADACLRVMRDPAFAARLGEAARRRVQERFTLERMVAAYEDLYQRQLERRR
jgi:glycosyltransferase involved in cell wall biosynthesis